ncbi:copper homeostasis protein CutC [Lactobacillus sp. wkB10]|uniref:copper homeostasis protein CutC n=1 Tax=Lactobacillus sp. wkB10 TaxID=1545701 RepID=UPI000513CA94|nr:copper homeostasis protein CutC [Lactobacillus sp. wkB10]KGG54151.1 Cytoplasmic copper homeostasis protein cutC [Lactobacillus sp. wkB10]MCT6891977.1 copper homeostasis protein CutC [Lactobacillus sp.]
MLKEACVENFYNIPHVIKAGADRLELNNDLALGGTTPSYGVIKKSVTYAENFKIPVVIMIRPRGGDFVYSENEIDIMADDIEASAKLGAQGVAFGCLTTNNQINRIQMKHLITLARSLNVEVVMHMAFDDISNDKQKTELNWLADQGVKRILTHGGKLDKPILATILHLKEIIKWANDRIEILPGGGITTENRDDIAKKLQLNELHGSKIV